MLQWGRSLLIRFREGVRYYSAGLVREMSNKNVFLYAQAIAFKVLVSIVPVIILAAGITGQVLRAEHTFNEIQEIIINFLPAYESEQLIAFLDQFLRASPQLTIIGLIGLLLIAITLFTTIRIGITGTFEQEWHEERTLLRGYLFDLRMVLQVGLFFMLTIALTIIAQMINTEAIDLLQWIGLDLLREGWRRFIYILGLLLPFLITAGMFFQLYRYTPKPRPPRRSALVGALTAGVLWEVAKYGFTLYATYLANFERYEHSGPTLGEDGIAALGTSFGLIIAFVFWVYYSGIVLLIGAILASLHEQRLRARRNEGAPQSPPDSGAPSIRAERTKDETEVSQV